MCDYQHHLDIIDYQYADIEGRVVNGFVYI